MGMGSPGLETPGYRQALIIFRIGTDLIFTSLNMSQISPGAFFCFCQLLEGPTLQYLSFSLNSDRVFLIILFVRITAIVPGQIPFSFLSGLCKIPNSFDTDSPYCLIFIFECSVQCNFLYPPVIKLVSLYNFTRTYFIKNS